MSNKYKILELLKKNELTVKEIMEKTDFNENEVRTYVHRLLKDKLVKIVGKKERWVIYGAIKEPIQKIETDPDLKNKLKVYHTLFEKVINQHFNDLNDDIIEYIEKHNEFSEEI